METFSWLNYTMISTWLDSKEKERTIVGLENMLLIILSLMQTVHISNTHTYL